ncbi:hypothetical protein [Pseudobacteriovorax antillogorgiicola]|uniref:Lipoprotein n=1 Tax=Pseudobacteriovorax antillogorgiicola TaxID=1513793 RepID=A0A1Y6C8A2_9BACT|nr:hypothetical protein [Pseudobacteriovorax antillogorgiicola]TCS49367.1 hypothetical protein EDD56_11547 [Pseudobacteriovorax antillogorgiicola]SMF47465.1 hypothetical protein SAMN06296036_114137 [Pseudobacteriovorax antillogorgiicola]
MAIRILALLALGSLLGACEDKEKGYYQHLSSINSSIQEGSVEKIDNTVGTFSNYVEKNKLYDEKSFLSKDGISETVSFMNCVEDYKKVLERKVKQESELLRWNTNLKEVKNPLTLRSLPEPEKAFASIEQKIEATNLKIQEIDVELRELKILCDSNYSKLVSLYNR